MNKHILIITSAAVFSLGVFQLLTFPNLTNRVMYQESAAAQTIACTQSTVNAIGTRTFTGGTYQSEVACLTENSTMYRDDTRFKFFKVGTNLKGKSIAFIKTDNLNIKDNTNLSWTAQITQNADVYVFYRKIEGQTKPAWLSNYTKLSANTFEQLDSFLLRVNEQGLVGVYDIYKYNGTTPATVTFGPASTSSQTAFSMYLVGVSPKSGTGTTAPSQSGNPTSSPIQTAPPTGGSVIDSQSGQAITSKYGIYPNCIAPGTPIESHSWWTEDAEVRAAINAKDRARVEEEQLKRSRHIHYGICAPNTRDTNGQALTVSGQLDVVARVVTFNHPGPVTYVEGALCGDGAGSGCPGGMHRDFSPSKRCQTAVNVDKECIYYMKMTVDTTKAPHNGIVELRMRANSFHPDLNNGRQFTTMNAEIYVKNANLTRTTNYRGGNPIARGWYTGLDYAIGVWGNFINLFGPDLKRTVPLLKGTVSIKTSHSSASGLVNYRTVIDPDYHHRKAGTVLYADTNPEHLTTLDTTKLSNGRHLLFVETTETNNLGAHKGQLRLDFDVQN